MSENPVENIIMRKNAAGTPADSGAANAAPKNGQNEQKNSSIFTPKQGADFSKIFSNNIVIGVQIFILVLVAALFVGVKILAKKRKAKEYERSLKLIPLLIHLPPATDDIQGGGRDERDVNEEAISQSTIMYSIIASTLKKESFNTKLYGQKYFSFEMVVVDGLVKYYAVVPAVTTEIVKQAIQSSYPTARLEEAEVENIFSNAGLGDEAKEDEDSRNVAGGELIFKKEEYYPIQVFSESKWDAQLAILNAFAKAKKGEGLGLQLMFRPVGDSWRKKVEEIVKNLREGKKVKSGSGFFGQGRVLNLIMDVIRAPFEVPELHEYDRGKETTKEVSQAKLDEAQMIENKTKYPVFECLIRVVAHSSSHERSEALVGGVVAAFSQLDSPTMNGFKYDMAKKMDTLVTNYIFRFFPTKKKGMILNTQELASIFHLPSEAAIPSSGVERQMTKQVDAPTVLVEEGLELGVNEYRGNTKMIKLGEDDRRRHTYIIGSSGMGKSVLLKNLAYQDMLAGKGFCFIDPHGDVTEELLSMVPENRIDDVIYFDPSDTDFPIGMNMLEFATTEQKDFIVQEGINMLYSLYDPGHTGIFGPRGEQMFRNAALLLMSDPRGATFLDIPSPFINPDLVADKLKYVTDRDLFDYWTKEFPASQKSNDAGEVVTWFASKWSPFKQNTMMKRVLGQTKSGFNIREIMDQQKILLVNLSKGKLGELNSKLLGMIFVMKFQTAAMSRVDTPEHERKDFCLFVDEFQNFSTESFESILSEARKFRLNLIVANQFMTQLTDKIREGVLGNVGTIIAGRLGVTDAEMMEKVFTPTFKAEDLHKQPNHHAIATVLMHGMPSAPFTMRLLPPRGKEDRNIFAALKDYSAKKYGRPGEEVEKEIEDRLRISDGDEGRANIENGNFASNEPWDGAMDAALGLDNFDRDEKGIPLGVKKVPASEAKAGSPEMAEFLEKMKADETSRASGAGKNEVFDNEAPHNDESNGDAKFTLDDINAELDNLMAGKSAVVADNLMAGKSAVVAEPEVVNVPMEAVSEANQEDGRLKDGTVIKVR